MAELVEFVELIHCNFLQHPTEVAALFAEHRDLLADVLGKLKDGEDPFQGSPEDGLASLPDFIDLLAVAYRSAPDDVVFAFAGHQVLLDSIIRILDGEEVNVDDNGPPIDLNGEQDVVKRVQLLQDPKVSVSWKMQAATLLQSNLWVEEDNAGKLLQCQAATAIPEVIAANAAEDDFLVKCCRILEALFSFDGSPPVVDAASRQIVKGPHLRAMGNTWHPASFLCGRTQQPITGEFYVINHVPCLPETLSPAEKEGLTIHRAELVQPSELPKDRAAQPYMDQFLAKDGLALFLKALAENLVKTRDDYGVENGVRVIRRLVEAGALSMDTLVQALKDIHTAGVLVVFSYCCALKTTFTAASLTPFKSQLLELLAELKRHEELQDHLERFSHRLRDL